MADWSKTKPSKNFIDQTDPRRSLQAWALDPYAPWPDGSFEWNENERKRLGKGEDVLNILRERMRNIFLQNWLTEGRPMKNFDAYQETFPTHSNLRKRSKGSSYDNY